MADDATPMNLHRRRRALGLGHVNGGLWAVGNALSTGSLVVYLASDLGAQGLGLSLVLATPNLAGLLRLVAPAIVYWAGTARRACLSTSLASYLLIVGLPVIAAVAPAISRTAAVAAMIGLLFAHQLLEYIGTVALWAWWGDLVPQRVRGRYFARRQMIQLSLSIPTLLAGGYFADCWRHRFEADPDRLLLAYAVPMGLGAAFLLMSLVPLVLMPATRRYPRPDAGLVRSAIAAPFTDRRFWRLLVFRSWFSLANGVTQVVQSAIYPKYVLGFGVGPMSALRVVTGVGQLGGARFVGKWSDRFGNRPVLMAAQVCVSLSLVFGTGNLPCGIGGFWVTEHHEESHVEYARRLIEEQYESAPTGCGGSFGEILCWEIHSNGMTFKWLAEKWGISLPFLGELLWDHCKRLEPPARVNHAYPSRAQCEHFG